MSRRNSIIRTVATLTGDFALGYAMASACVWIIQSAALGVFLSFMLWLVAVLMALALSQHLVHPAVAFALSDSKLDRGIDALASLAETARAYGLDLRAPLLRELGQRLSRFARKATV